MIVIDEPKTKTMSLFHTKESLSQEVAGLSRLPDTQIPPLRLQRKSVRKRSNLEEAAIGLFWKATEALRTPHSVEEDFSDLCKILQVEEGQCLLCPTPPPATPPTPEPQPGRKRLCAATSHCRPLVCLEGQQGEADSHKPIKEGKQTLCLEATVLVVETVGSNMSPERGDAQEGQQSGSHVPPAAAYCQVCSSDVEGGDDEVTDFTWVFNRREEEGYK
ncbi:hypothetical protein AB205_0081900 [Aquarana catesbeiana]|uniref:Uncharacterized protein n=1 Tax=Aquarana catesbeiana TaxID=8400 RepID=A0A2G9QLS5_AQUCT|nr:hypothetical protein AB205_0081900 [Aquarana catesbeiana]